MDVSHLSLFPVYGFTCFFYKMKAEEKINRTHVLSAKGHDWSQPLIGGAQDIGFDDSFISPEGIQRNPYAFLHNGHIQMNMSNITFWRGGNYNMPFGTSMILDQGGGEGDPNWDSTAYNQILVNKTIHFVDSHLKKNANTSDDEPEPMFMYVALGSVHVPHSPPTSYRNGVPVDGEYPTRHMDLLLEMDLTVGSLVSMIEERGLGMCNGLHFFYFGQQKE